MKKLACLTISFLVISLVFAQTFLGTAFAAAETVYPADFTETIVFSSLTDFAVGDNGYAFIDGGKLITITGDEKKDDYEISPAAVDYVDGEFICSDSTGKVYSLPALTESDKTITQFPDILYTENNCVYTLLSDGTLVYYDAASGTRSEIDCGCTFKILKTYSGTIYAAGTDESSARDRLYTINGAEAYAVDEQLIYIDYTASHYIYTGTAADSGNAYSLYNMNADEVHFVTLTEGAYMTGIDLQDAILSSSQYFTVSSQGTFKVGDSGKPQGGDTALLLCVTGNASIVAIGETTYIMPTEGTEESDINVTVTPAETLKGIVVASPCEIYSAPFISPNTETAEIEIGSEVTVKEIITLSGVLISDVFYKIEYTDEGRTISGYVPQSCFSTYTYIESDPVEITDGTADASDYISSVVIVLIIVALVLIAICYLVYVSTSNKNKPKN